MYALNFMEEYGFEFNSSVKNAFIMAPESERIMFNLLTSVTNSLGGLINGSSGVGKTETVKALCHGLARPYISWTCRGGTSYQCLARILKGMAMGGFWICLDEIN